VSDPRPDAVPLVHVVDGEPEQRAAGFELLSNWGFEVRCYSDPEEFLGTFRPRRPQCFLLDVFLPRMSGLELQRRLLDRCPSSSIILVTARASTQVIVQAFRQGAVDFLEKPWRPEDLLEAVGRAIEKDRVRGLESVERREVGERLASLSQRENEVLALVVQGHSSKSAAKALHVSKRTIDFHRANLMHKLAARTVAEDAALEVGVAAREDRAPGRSRTAASAGFLRLSG
jgi:FixJ family two-component response regulator